MVTGSHTAADVALLYKDQDGRCLYCGCSIAAGYHVDHMIPIARGGSNDPENLALACPGCNLSKGARTAAEFIDAIDPIGVAS